MKKKNSFVKDFCKGLLGAIVFFALFDFAAVCVFGADRAQTPADTYGACCRVFQNGVAGSGTCFLQDENGDCYILTNYHVAGKSDCDVEFFEDGDPVRVRAVNVWRAYDDGACLDCAVLKVAAADAGCIKKFVPLWTDSGDLGGETITMTTVGAPRAKWLRMIRGKIKDNGGKVNENLVFKPTPYGGQSGSSIIIEKGGKPWVGGLLTWRQGEEGAETFGGLAQPIARVIKAMSGETAELPHVTLPAEAVECPNKIKAGEYDGKTLYINGRLAVECAAREVAAPVSVEVWCINGCQACTIAKTDGLPIWSKWGGCRVRDASGADRFNAAALNITAFPTIRIVDAGGAVIYKEIGYNSAVKANVLSLLKKYNTPTKTETAEKITTTATDTACGRFNVLPDIIKRNEAEKGATDGDDGQAETPPAIDPPKAGGGILGGGITDKIGDQIGDQIRGAIDEFSADLIKDYSGKLKAAVFWICFLACTLALICFKTVVGVLSAIWSCFKWAGRKAADFIRGLGQKSLDAIAAAVNEKKTTKKDDK